MSFQHGTTWPEAVRHASELARRTGVRQRVELVGVDDGRRWYWWRNVDDPGRAPAYVAAEMGA